MTEIAVRNGFRIQCPINSEILVRISPKYAVQRDLTDPVERSGGARTEYERADEFAVARRPEGDRRRFGDLVHIGAVKQEIVEVGARAVSDSEAAVVAYLDAVDLKVLRGHVERRDEPGQERDRGLDDGPGPPGGPGAVTYRSKVQARDFVRHKYS